jgi:hypothetical protein
MAGSFKRGLFLKRGGMLRRLLAPPGASHLLLDRSERWPTSVERHVLGLLLLGGSSPAHADESRERFRVRVAVRPGKVYAGTISDFSGAVYTRGLLSPLHAPLGAALSAMRIALGRGVDTHTAFGALLEITRYFSLVDLKKGYLVSFSPFPDLLPWRLCSERVLFARVARRTWSVWRSGCPPPLKCAFAGLLAARRLC